MSVSVSSVVSAAVRDANVLITVLTTAAAVLALNIPVPASDQHWLAGAVVFVGFAIKALKGVVADLTSASA